MSQAFLGFPLLSIRIEDPILTYYRRPTYIEIDGVLNTYTGDVATADVESEFKDDVVELMLDEAAAIIAGDIDNYNQSWSASIYVG